MKLNIPHRIIQYIIFFTLWGCVEPFEPVLDKYENLLVVDGLLTDEPGHTRVKLSRSHSYQDYGIFPEKDASVFIKVDQKTMISFQETSEGIYIPVDPLFKGEQGRSYQLIISTSGGKKYESPEEILKPSPSIDSIFYEFIELKGMNDASPVFAIRFFVSSHDETGQTRYYRWEWEETWEYHAPVESENYPGKTVCYKSDHSKTIHVGSSVNLTGDVIEKAELGMISNETDRLKHKYSLLVKQYAISGKEHEYWSNLEKLNEQTGTLFDPVPSSVKGNIGEVSDPSEPVLGYFMVSGVSFRRIMISRENLPAYFYFPNNQDCEVVLKPATVNIGEMTKQGLVYVDTRPEFFNGRIQKVHRFVKSTSCFDCTVTGSATKPEYWDDEE